MKISLLEVAGKTTSQMILKADSKPPLKWLLEATKGILLVWLLERGLLTILYFPFSKIGHKYHGGGIKPVRTHLFRVHEYRMNWKKYLMVPEKRKYTWIEYYGKV